MPKKKKLSSEELGNNFYKSGWQPGYEIDEVTGLGEITHVGNDPNYQSKYDEILKEWGFNPDQYEIDGQVRASSWQTQLKGGRVETFYAFKGLVRRKKPGHDKYLKEILTANKECTTAVLEISNDGLARIVFNVNDFKAVYYMVATQGVD